MIKIRLWQIEDRGPVKISASQVSIEKQLESWIEEDPSLIQTGLIIVGRQLSVEGGCLDLLALDPQGRWVVIEIKRGQLHREAIAQVIDYASCFALLEPDELREKTNAYLQGYGKTIDTLLAERSAEDALDIDGREVLLVIVGTGKATGLDRMTEYLATHYQIPLSAVTFGVFETSDGKEILVRELTEPEVEPEPTRVRKPSMLKLEQIVNMANKAGVGTDFRAILDASIQHELYPRPYKKSIMYTPPFKRNRCLFSVWAENHEKRMKSWVSPSAFAEFYAISEDEVAEALQIEGDGWQMMDSMQVTRFVKGLHDLFGRIEKEAT